MKFLSLTVTLFLSQLIYSQPTTTFEWPENEITPIFKEFVTAYNTNDLKKLQAFTKKTL